MMQLNKRKPNEPEDNDKKILLVSQVDGKKDDEGSLYNAIRPFCGRMLKLAFKRQMSNVKIC